MSELENQETANTPETEKTQESLLNERVPESGTHEAPDSLDVTSQSDSPIPKKNKGK